MKNIILVISVISLGLLTGCDKTTSTIGGAAVGTAVGAGIGSAIGGHAGGVALGAVLGGLGGAAIGSNMGEENERKEAASCQRPQETRRVRELERKVRRQDRELDRSRRESRRSRNRNYDYVEEYEYEEYCSEFN